jgi:hypothetical protein
MPQVVELSMNYFLKMTCWIYLHVQKPGELLAMYIYDICKRKQPCHTHVKWRGQCFGFELKAFHRSPSSSYRLLSTKDRRDHPRTTRVALRSLESDSFSIEALSSLLTSQESS